MIFMAEDTDITNMVANGYNAYENACFSLMVIKSQNKKIRFSCIYE